MSPHRSDTTSGRSRPIKTRRLGIRG
jgi:hypothetical protein